MEEENRFNRGTQDCEDMLGKSSFRRKVRVHEKDD
jgi:hypothetical protein